LRAGLTVAGSQVWGLGGADAVKTGSGADYLVGNTVLNSLNQVSRNASGGAVTASGHATVSADIFVKDLVNGQIALVSRSASGVAANGASTHAQISLGGDWIVFESGASNLASTNANGSAALNGGGNSLNKLITGYDAANGLSGGSGNDTMDGSTGNDSLAGGNGNDVFVLNSTAGSDTLSEFVSGADDVRISMSALRVGDGSSIALYLFAAAGADAGVSASELTLLATLTSTVAGNYLFGA
jgi:Ca2+-binding RTX toxin-like protein